MSREVLWMSDDAMLSLQRDASNRVWLCDGPDEPGVLIGAEHSWRTTLRVLRSDLAGMLAAVRTQERIARTAAASSGEAARG